MTKTLREWFLEMGPRIASMALNAHEAQYGKEEATKRLEEVKDFFTQSEVLIDSFQWRQSPEKEYYWSGIAHAMRERENGTFQRTSLDGFQPDHGDFIRGYQLIFPGKLPPT